MIRRAFWIWLQCCHAVTKYIFGWFVGGIFGQKTPNLYDPYSISATNPAFTDVPSSKHAPQLSIKMVGVSLDCL